MNCSKFHYFRSHKNNSNGSRIWCGAEKRLFSRFNRGATNLCVDNSPLHFFFKFICTSRCHLENSRQSLCGTPVHNFRSVSALHDCTEGKKQLHGEHFVLPDTGFLGALGLSTTTIITRTTTVMTMTTAL